MKRISRMIVFMLLLTALSVLLVPAAAQDAEIPGPGEGEPVILPNLGSDIATLNPILSNDGSSTAVINRLYPALVGVDPDTLNFETGFGSLATGWEISEDGMTYTFTLRDDMFWSDGTQVTSADYKYSFDAIVSGETNTALTYVLDDLAAVDAPDAQTVVVTLNAPSCAALSNISFVPVVPAHIFSERFPTFADMNEADILATGDVSASPWTFSNFRPGEQVTLLADPDYPDTFLDYVVPEGWIYKNVADENLIWEQFLAGQLTEGTTPEGRQDELRGLAADGYSVVEFPSNNFRFISLNTADPDNPQSAVDENGVALDQGHHPILGDVRVRQALMYAMDWEAINQGALGGEGVQMSSHVFPDSWAYNPDVAFYPYDPEVAAQLLDEAGFVDDDGDASTPRVATEDALYAEPGTPLAFEFLTNAGNEASESIGILLVDQWGLSGFDVDFQAIDFNILVDNLTGQTFDAIMIFWGFAFPDDPNGVRVTFDPANDVVGSGFNVISYNNPEVTDLLDQANTVAGCDQAARAELYGQVFQILRDEVPWIWMGTQINVYGAQPWVQNYDPRHSALRFWNEDGLVISSGF